MDWYLALRILIIHEWYQSQGGEDIAVRDEIEMLPRYGVDVRTLLKHNSEIKGSGSLPLALKAIWSGEGYRLTREAIAREKPDLVHVHNAFPLFSPSVLTAARASGMPVIHSLHNFRYLCANAVLVTGGEPCQRCVGLSVKWPGIQRACYRNSHAGSAAVGAIAGVHHAIGTFNRSVDRYFAPTGRTREILIRGGFPAERTFVRSNSVPDPGTDAARWSDERDGVLFVGRLSAEKGVELLIDYWRELEIPLTIIGDGHLRASLERKAGPNVRFLGHLPRAEVYRHMARSALLLFPSLAQETFGLVIAEGMANGLPCLAQADGSASELIEMAGRDGAGHAGWLMPARAPEQWREQIKGLFGNRELLARAGAIARQIYERNFTPDVVIQATIEHYRDVIDKISRR
jgi:glycosyltransferase involved in cell wall biosynthesis